MLSSKNYLLGKKKRNLNFVKRCQYNHDEILEHKLYGWKYLPIHIFADDSKQIQEYGLSKEMCQSVDIWWGVDGDATLLECRAVNNIEKNRYTIFEANNDGNWVYLLGEINISYVTRQDVENAMSYFYKLGYPSKNILDQVSKEKKLVFYEII
ncbi:hypothetical protein ACFODO_07735 [Acinetobacter sichuanensis]|uniref:Uncharacterized protein n=1 Tax=Acinetobacter sichuanensis TaxID=2136183 RepID=A0A371YK14_9GAMM|nr:hypothetical protein [Acinetobacter sichuanensis]RFC81806.1 hypothetical protein C9E89_019885 [Acinetobacter sichuanensis]